MRVTLHTRLEPGREEDHRDVHRTIPPELAAALARAGVRDWEIDADGLDLLHVLDVEDHRAMRRLLRDDPANTAWQSLVGPLHDVADSHDGDADGLTRLWSLTGQVGPPAAGARP